MVDQVTVTNPIKIDEKQASTWAQELTMGNINRNITRNNQILERMARARNIDISGLSDLSRTAGAAAEGIRRSSATTTQVDRNRRRSAQEVADAMYDLKNNTRRVQDGFKSIIEGTARPLQAVPNLATSLGNLGATSAAASRSLGRFAPLFALLGTSTAAVITRFMDGAEQYRSMIATGILFNGSIESMIEGIRTSGVSMQAASQIIQNRTQAIIVGGEQEFFRSVGSMGNTFARFGMTMDQGAETLSELMDQQRLTGSLFTMSQEEIIRANTTQLNQMHAMSRLTGISLRQQMDERRRVAERLSMRVMAAQMPVEERARYEQMLTAVTNTGIPAEAAEGLLMQLFGRGTTRIGGLAQISLGPEVMSVLQQATSTGDVDLIRQNQELFQSGLQRMLGGLSVAGVAQGGTSAEIAGIVIPALDRIMPGVTGPTAAARQEQAGTAARGESLLSAGTEGFYKTTNATAIALGSLEAAIMKTVSGPMNSLWENLGSAADRLASFTQALGQRSIQEAISEHPETAAALGIAGAGALGAGALAMRRSRASASAASAAAAGANTPAGLRPNLLSRSASRLGRLIPGGGGVIAGGSELMETGDWWRSLAVGAGSFAGGLAGAAGGTILGPAGTIAGGVGGGLLGEYYARQLYDLFARGISSQPSLAPVEPPTRAPTVTPASSVPMGTVTPVQMFEQARMADEQMITAINSGMTTLATLLTSLNDKLDDDALIVRRLSEITSAVDTSSRMIAEEIRRIQT